MFERKPLLGKHFHATSKHDSGQQESYCLVTCYHFRTGDGQRQLIMSEVEFAQHDRSCARRTNPLNGAQVNKVRGCSRKLDAATVKPAIKKTAMHVKT
jgi:hypothetical protein